MIPRQLGDWDELPAALHGFDLGAMLWRDLSLAADCVTALTGRGVSFIVDADHFTLNEAKASPTPQERAFLRANKASCLRALQLSLLSRSGGLEDNGGAVGMGREIVNLLCSKLQEPDAPSVDEAAIWALGEVLRLWMVRAQGESDLGLIG